MNKTIRINGKLYEQVSTRTRNRRLNEAQETYLYGCPFYLEAGVEDIDEAQDYLDDDHDLMLDLFNEDIRGEYRSHRNVSNDSPLINWRWYLKGYSSGYFIYETSRELTKEELENLGEGTTGQAADGLGEGFEQQPWACYTTYYRGGDDEYEEEIMCSFNWKDDYVIKPLSNSYRKYLK